MTRSSLPSRRSKAENGGSSRLRGRIPFSFNTATNMNRSRFCSFNQILQGVLLLSLGILLGHNISLMKQGSSMVNQQQDALEAGHKYSFFMKKKGNTEQQQQQRSVHGEAVVSKDVRDALLKRRVESRTTTKSKISSSTSHRSMQKSSVLKQLKILAVVVAYDFSQIPHLEETMDGYHDLCSAGAAQVHVQVHTTVMYPVVWLDLYNTRYNCANFQLTFVIKNKSLRLHLVDEHRRLFYDEINNYDLFIYTEDDIRVTPTTVATYWQETERLQQRTDVDYRLYNVGIVRYEYNFPSVVIDDKTRHATENVTRVYWEHSHAVAQSLSIVPEAASGVASLNTPSNGYYYYVHMRNHHQGMYLATREHLLKWKELPNCQFDIAINRPGRAGNPQQPLLGTQRVWISSYQLYEPNYCNIQQAIPVTQFGALTVHHIPNKNYRRKQGGKTQLHHASNNTLDYSQGSPKLIKALQLHLAMRQKWPQEPKKPYCGIQVLDQVTQDRDSVLDLRIKAYRQYVQRGGVLSEEDMVHTDLVEPENEL